MAISEQYPWLYNLLALWPWADYLAYVSLDFLIYKISIALNLEVCSEDYMGYIQSGYHAGWYTVGTLQLCFPTLLILLSDLR